MAASELKSCIFLSMESLLIGGAIGVVKRFIQSKKNKTSFSIRKDKTILKTMVFSSAVCMITGFFAGISGVKGIIQSVFLHMPIDPQSIIGILIGGGGAGGVASNGILLFLLLLLVFTIQGILIAVIVGLFFSSASSVFTAGVRHGIIETLFFSLKDDDTKYTGKVFLKYIKIFCSRFLVAEGHGNLSPQVRLLCKKKGREVTSSCNVQCNCNKLHRIM
jgi:hypothetical protein